MTRYLLFIAALLFSGSALAQDPIALATEPVQQTQHANISERLHRALDLTPDQRTAVDPIIQRHQDEITAILQDPVLTKSGKNDRVVENLDALEKDLQPLIREDQKRRLHREILSLEGRRAGFLGLGIYPLVNFTYVKYFPTSSDARAVFGSAPWSYGFGIGFASTDVKRFRVGFSFDTFAIPGGGNQLFVATPDVFAQYQVPIAPRVRAYGRIAAGPSFMDYAYNTPDHRHFAAKRLGASGATELGLRLGPVRLAAVYRAMTQPSGLDFDGLQVSATVDVFRF